MRNLVVALSVMLAAALGAAWFYRDTALVQRLIRSPMGLALTLPSALPSGGAGEKGAKGAKSSGTARKCLSEGRVVYTDGPCPQRSREEPMIAGSLTVVPGQRPTEPPQGVSSPLGGNARDLLINANGPNLRDKRMEQAIGK